MDDETAGSARQLFRREGRADELAGYGADPQRGSPDAVATASSDLPDMVALLVPGRALPQ